MLSRNKGLFIALGVTGLAVLVALGWSAANIGKQGTPVDMTSTGCTDFSDLSGTHPGMVWVEGGTFMMGAEGTYFEEGPAHEETVAGFWIDQHEVTNRQFAEFVDATGYLTLAERGIENPATGEHIPGSAVFAPHVSDEPVNPFEGWWRFMENANWQQPKGPGSSIDGLENHPVVHIAFEDAQAYARWKGHELPTEAQFEFAAQSSQMKDANGEFQANTWQGLFPFQHDTLDGYTGSSPVGCYTANHYGLYDMIGNVWEWTQTPYFYNHAFADRDKYPEGLDPNQPGEPVAVIKGSSYLCAPNYCMRYRPEARQAQSKGLGTSHIGFRTVINP